MSIPRRSARVRHEWPGWHTRPGGDARTLGENVVPPGQRSHNSDLYGLPQSEILGLRWSDIDLHDRTLTIQITRITVTGTGVVEGEPKTERGPPDAAA